MLQIYFPVINTFWLASALLALSTGRPMYGVWAVVGLWSQIMVILIVAEHPNLATLSLLSLVWAMCVRVFWKDVIDSLLNTVVCVKRLANKCCGPRDFVITSRKHLALYATGPGSSPPLLDISPMDRPGRRIHILSKKVDKPFLERTLICYKYLGDDYTILDSCINSKNPKDLREIVKSAPFQLFPSVQVYVTFVGQMHELDMTHIFRQFYLSHFPAEKTLFDFGLAVAALQVDGYTTLKLPRTRIRFTHLISDQTAEYSIDFADPSQTLTLDVILRDLEDENQDGAFGQEETKEGDPLITEVKEGRGLVEEDQIPKFIRLKTGRDKQFVGDKEEEEVERPGPATPITETFEEEIDDDLRPF